jgi:hypothetical protein
MHNREIFQIAKEIKADWKNVNYAAKPYLEAMEEIKLISDNYYSDPASHIVRYFLSNASAWRGSKAAQIKAELKSMLRS